jgi:hypothetical protein
VRRGARRPGGAELALVTGAALPAVAVADVRRVAMVGQDTSIGDGHAGRVGGEARAALRPQARAGVLADAVADP